MVHTQVYTTVRKEKGVRERKWEQRGEEGERKESGFWEVQSVKKREIFRLFKLLKKKQTKPPEFKVERRQKQENT